MEQPTDNKQLRLYDNHANYKLFSVDEIIAQGLNHWKDWHCSAGARNLYIDYDGNVWVANCASSNFYGKVHAKRIENFTNKLNNQQHLDNAWKEYRESIIGTDDPNCELRKKWLNENTVNGWPMPKHNHKDSEQQHKLMAEIARLEAEFFTPDKLEAHVGDRNNQLYKKFLKSPENWSYKTTVEDKDWGLLGSIYTHWEAPDTWLKCPYTSCGCGADVILSKAKTVPSVGKLFVTNLGLAGQKHGFKTNNQIKNPHGMEMNFPIVHQILWDITRRCNYDCDYCWPSVHNNVEAHHAYEKIIQTIDKAVDQWAEGDEIRWNFGGGEPTMHPQFMDILKHLNHKKQWVLVTTNGSRSAKFWSEAVRFINSVNMSAHFESMDKFKGNEQRFIENCKVIIDHHKQVNKDHWIEIKLMTPPGYLDRASEFKEKIIELGLDAMGANNRQIGAISLVPIRALDDASKLVGYSDNELSFFQQQ